MKRLLLTILISGIFCYASAQYKKIDSLKHLLTSEKNDTTAILLQAELAHAYLYYKPDSCLLLARIALVRSQKIDFLNGEGRSYKEIGDALEQMGNYPGAMTAYLKHLHSSEQLGKAIGIVQALTNIGILYMDQNEYQKAIDYTLEAKNQLESIKNKKNVKNYDLNKMVILLNTGFYYYNLNKLDSALLYEQDAYQLCLDIRNDDNLGEILQNLGMIQEKYNNRVLAITYYRMSSQSSLAQRDYSTLTDTYLKMAGFFRSSNVTDSSLYYAKLALVSAKAGSYTKGVFDASNFLADIYGNFDKSQAYDYLKVAGIARDSLFDEEKIKKIQDLRYAEQVRELDIAELKKQQDEEHKNNLQLSGIAFFIPVFFLVLLLLSKVKVHHRFIEAMSILSILFLFEFVTLMLHSYVGDVSKHTPYIVCIAAIMIPLHHRFNHWLIGRLTNLHKWGNHHTNAPVNEAENAKNA
jgi:tetratricopeptide (TPR) repeat protein